MATVSTSIAPPQEQGTPPRRRKEPPERKFGPFANGVGVCIWQNHAQTEQGTRTFRSITLNAHRYFDRESQQWKDSPSFTPSDLPSLIYALQLAASYCYEQDMPDQEGGESPAFPSGNGEEIPF